MNDIERLTELIENAMIDIENTDIRIDGLPPELAELGEKICTLLRYGKEITCFTDKMADGDFQAPPPDRSNYIAGPIKDLYSKFRHLDWQLRQVAKGDYSQHIDFMGGFSDSFNTMIRDLKLREQTILVQNEERLRMIDNEKHQLQLRLERQEAHYRAYREYTESFLKFRDQYKSMMGEVHTLFQNGEYEKARLHIAKINDIMGTNVILHREYSNHHDINATLTEIASLCKLHDIAFNSIVYIPDGFALDPDTSSDLVGCILDLVYTLLEMPSHTGRRLQIMSKEKSHWLTISVEYTAQSGAWPELSATGCASCLVSLREAAICCDALLEFEFNKDTPSFHILLHLPNTPSLPSEQE